MRTLIEQTFNRDGLLYFACIEKPSYFILLNSLKYLNCGHVRKFVTLSIIFWTICSKLYRQSVGISMGTNFAPLVADLFLFLYCYERDLCVYANLPLILLIEHRYIFGFHECLCSLTYRQFSDYG